MAHISGVRFESDSLRHHVGTGCVSAIAKDTSGQVVMVATASCPRWYYSTSAVMTCLLPPEAAHQLRKLNGGDSFEGLNPDQIMRGDAGEIEKARRCIGKLYDEAREVVVDRYWDEVAIEICRTKNVDVQAEPVLHRRVLKRAMHSLGLGLRHVHLLVKQLELETDRWHVLDAVHHAKDSDG